MDYAPFISALNRTALSHWAPTLTQQIEQGLSVKRWGDLPRWQAILDALPNIEPSEIALDQSAVAVNAAITEQQQAQLKEQLKGFHPWRKGPFNLFDIAIDTEWRSDWKWDRLKNHIQPLIGKRVLDIGCGSGYHCWRMRGAGADLVVGIEPSPLFVCQFFALQHFINDHQVGVLPLRIEDLPEQLQFFDATFSMGVLYHRRSPIDHLVELKETLRTGGELVLETLVIDGGVNDVLVPQGRYAKMGNVWFIPSAVALEKWLKKVGFLEVRLIDETTTSLEEQRPTDWMTFQSLEDFLDPHDKSLTIEGYPAPKRAIFSAIAP